MTKTLADLAPQDLANCVGMWVDVPHRPHPVVYTGEFQSTGEIKYGAAIFDPRYGTDYERLDDCTLRPDLPRAWTSLGAPINKDVDQEATFDSRSLYQAIGKIAAGATTARDEIVKKLSGKHQ